MSARTERQDPAEDLLGEAAGVAEAGDEPGAAAEGERRGPRERLGGALDDGAVGARDAQRPAGAVAIEGLRRGWLEFAERVAEGERLEGLGDAAQDRGEVAVDGGAQGQRAAQRRAARREELQRVGDLDDLGDRLDLRAVFRDRDDP